MEEQKPGTDIASVYRRAGEVANQVTKTAEKHKLFVVINGEKYLRAESLQATMVLAWLPEEPSAMKKADPKKTAAPTVRNRLHAVLKAVEKDQKKARALFTALTGKESSQEVDDKVIESLVSALYKVKDGSAEVIVSGTCAYIKDKPTGAALFGKVPPPSAPQGAAAPPPAPAAPSAASEPEMDPF